MDNRVRGLHIDGPSHMNRLAMKGRQTPEQHDASLPWQRWSSGMQQRALSPTNCTELQRTTSAPSSTTPSPSSSSPLQTSMLGVTCPPQTLLHVPVARQNCSPS